MRSEEEKMMGAHHRDQRHADMRSNESVPAEHDHLHSTTRTSIFFFITLEPELMMMMTSSLISSLLHSHVTLNLEWCDTIKLSNLLLPWKSGTTKRLQLLSTSETLLALEHLGRQGTGRKASPCHAPLKETRQLELANLSG